MEEELLRPATTGPVAPATFPAASRPAHAVPQRRTAEEEELEELQAEMAL